MFLKGPWLAVAGEGVGDGLSGRAMEAATCIVNKSEAEVSRDNSKHKGSEVGPSMLLTVAGSPARVG